MHANRSLLPLHADLLAASAISDEVAIARGYRSVEQRVRLTELGFTGSQARVPALLLPLWNVAGELARYQVRADEPRMVGDRVVKYELPRGSRMLLDVPPTCRPLIGNPAVPLFVTEGVRKADAAASLGLCCIDLVGVWNWRGTNEWGGKTALADWDSIALNGRDVYIVFDSDVMTKASVHAALARLREFLASRDANVFVIYLPPGPGATKVGLDDYLAAGHGLDDLLSLARTELRPLASAADAAGHGIDYRQTPGGIVWDRPTGNGPVPVPLTNFGARIVGQVVEDDGAEQQRQFEIEATHRGQTRRFGVPAGTFAQMNWSTEHLGAGAVVYPGLGIRDHARVAIQLLSGDPPERTVYTHTGWREINGVWVYLHGDGAIGPAGVVLEGIETRLTGALARFSLPAPPTGETLAGAIRAEVAFLDLAPDHLTVPLLAGVYRAVLGDVDFSLFLAGRTGSFKTEAAAVVEQHFGAGMDSRHLPGSWSSTPNSTEALLFSAKDTVFVVDDFAPAGSTADVQRLHGTADRVLRAAGNGSARQRMRADTSIRPPKPPRCLVLATGEDVPRGQSLRSRMLVLEVGPGDINPVALRVCQAHAAAGTYAAAMAGFIAWEAGRHADTRRNLAAEVVRLRDKARSEGAHRRTPDIVANLMLGIGAFLSFAFDAGVLDAAGVQRLRDRCWTALGIAAGGQADHQASSDPTGRFRELLVAAIASGRAHVTDPDGEVPENAVAWGWRSEIVGSGEHEREVVRPLGRQVGWLDGNDLFLDPQASYAAAQELGRAADEPLAIGARTLHLRLREAGLLLSAEGTRRRLTVRRSLSGARRTVLHLSSEVVLGTPGPFEWDAGASGPRGAAHAECTASPTPTHEHDVPGTVGPLGPLADTGETQADRDHAFVELAIEDDYPRSSWDLEIDDVPVGAVE